ncbi:non-ribosomal peptide synthetase [Streptomyces sp. NBC_01207]|uniref:non-ribosomal peptide synthetase n=1 Tax=Streptomyces sp. NBC_01207 TaxID=2903772 RepID=UPI002E145DEB|nr:non-ribosomal peptide synthetase [Streptomyces sp. NBC_01207]WSR12828.1 amino acid adenylation domain-containing protein [Streptomyces sp. NBC_01207]
MTSHNFNAASRRPAHTDEGGFPLSFAQQRLWFLSQLGLNQHEYLVPRVLRVRGGLDVEALETAFSGLVTRHEVLRTRFVIGAQGEPVQVIDEPGPVRIPLIDLSGVHDRASRETQARETADTEAVRPFDLTTDALLRVSLIQISDEDHIMVLAMHHIVSDGWSIGILTRELGELYAAAVQNRDAKLPELPLQYADYAIWQRQWLQGDILERQLGYWRNQLTGLEPLELPTDHPRPAERTGNGTSLQFDISPETTAGLRTLAADTGTSLYMVLLAAFNILLGTYARRDDIAVGTPIAGRNRAEIEGLIGFFVNTLVIRSDLSTNPTFQDFLTQIKDTTLAAYDQQDLPFERLVEELHPERDLSRTPLFQVMFILQNAAEEAWQFADLDTELRSPDETAATFDLVMSLQESCDGLRAQLIYSTDLFEAPTMQRLAGHFENLLTSVVTDPTAALSDLDMLSEAEKHQLVVEWNDTAADFPHDRCIHELVEAQASEQPDAPAVIFGDQELTYAQLNAKANQLAHYLRSLGVGRESLVAVCLDRGLDMIVSLLGVLKAGGAYVPLDPQYPAERLAFMLADTAAPVLLTQSSLRTQLPDHNAQTVFTDTDADTITAFPDTNPDHWTASNDLFYVIYTSGSTGTPKGVMVEHHSVVRQVHYNWLERLTPDDCVAQVTSFSWDSCAIECWSALVAGARLAVLLPDEIRNPFQLRRVVRERGVTALMLTASLFNHHVTACPDVFETVRYTKYCGEKVTRAEADSLIHGAHAPQYLLHTYGPTENWGDTTLLRVSQDSPSAASMPIGGPAPNTHLFVVDGADGLVPVGVPGELLVGGTGLARGYLNRPDLTAEKFVTVRVAGTMRQVYRTGDLARWLPSGVLEFLGRIDDQVKVRGMRIELGEIEAQLVAHEDVTSAVVTVREDSSGDKRLIAYVVPRKGVCPETSTLRRWCAHRLPDYMLPTGFLVLEKLPSTPNGKVDRRSLPAPDHDRPDLAVQYVAPRDHVETTVAGIWSQILGVDRVGIHDNFFDLGGHSLLATRTVSLMRQELGREVTVRDLFTSPTVEQLAEVINGAVSATDSVELVPVPRAEGGLPLSFAQQRLWFLEQLGLDGLDLTVPAMLRVRGGLDVEALETAFSGLVTRHEVLRTRFVIGAQGEPVQVIDEPGPVRIPLIDLSGVHDRASRETQARETADTEAVRPFDLTTDALLRVSLIQISDEDHIMVLAMHHIVSDGWSIGILTRELGELYAAAVQNRDAKLPELPLQYADYAIWQRQWLQGDILERQLGYWRNQLTGLEPLELPTDHPRPAERTGNGTSLQFDISPETTAGLRTLAADTGTSLYMVLLAAFNILLGTYARRDDIAVGTPIAGRNRAEIEGLIGFFVNTLVIRSDLSTNPTFQDFLTQIKDTTLAAYDQQDLPFERLVEELHPERDLSRTPLFQVMFILQNAAEEAWQFADLDIDTHPNPSKVAQFDLTLSLQETSEGLKGLLLYSTDLFEAPTMQRLAGHFENLLTSVITDPTAALSDLDILSEAEKHQLVVEWNDTAADFPHDRCIHELVEAQASEQPDAPAVIFGDQELTYAQLNAKANQLAHHLRTLGVGPDTLVAVCLDRGPNLIVALLGILKAGGAYVPLDPQYPAERLAFMLADTAAPILLTQNSLRTQLPDHNAQTVFTDTDADTITAFPDTNPDHQTTPDHLAYVIYTSGSTGTPKGVMIQHSGVVNMAGALQTEYRLHRGSRILQFASLAFDGSAFEIYSILGIGGTVVVASRPQLMPGGELENTIRTYGINTITLPPSVLERADTAFLEQLDVLIVGGEASNSESWLAWQRCPRLINGYGPSEATVCVVTYDGREAVSSSVPIGRPVANTEVFVVGQADRLVPVGVPGELLVGGVSLGRGYLNRPELTAEKFVEVEIGGKVRRVYRTGDLVRWLPSGNLEFLGRIDTQVKMRGIRIELGEIEARLVAHQDVASATAVLREASAGDKRLVAYVVPRRGATLDTTGMRRWCGASLPDYMVPAAFVYLDSLPLTPNGKVDRRALPAPETDRPELAAQYVAPRGEIETAVAGIWAEVLGVDQVGIHDNFFDLGGHSLLLTQVRGRLATRLDVPIPMVALFQHTSVRALALYLSERDTAPVDDTALARSRQSGRTRLSQRRRRSTSKGDS